MTDDFSDELDAIAADLPSLPSDFANLKALIQTLPTPDDASAVGSRTGQPTTDAAGTGGVPYALTGESGTSFDSAIVSPRPFFTGRANLLEDPAIQELKDILFFVSGGTGAGKWSISFSAFTGDAPSNRRLQRVAQRGFASQYTSHVAEMQVYETGDTASDILYRIDTTSNYDDTLFGNPYPWLVAAVQIEKLSAQDLSSLTACTVRLVIVDGNGVERATSATLDWLTLAADETHQLVAALQGPVGPAIWRWQLRISAVKDAGDIDLRVAFAEPQLHYAFSPTPAVYAPYISGWYPDQLRALQQPNATFELIRLYDDLGQVVFSLDDDAELEWGNGAGATDVRLRRVGVEQLRLDDAAGSGAAFEVNDILPHLAASWAIVYNGDGTVQSATRSGAAGAATTTITYAAGKVSSVVSVRGGRTVTVTPTYTGSQITSLARTVV